MRLALRCVLRHWAAQQGTADSTAGSTAGSAASDRYSEVLSLQHHWERLQDGAKLEYAQMGALAHRLLGACCAQAAETLTPRDMAQLLARFGANSHTIRCVARCAAACALTGARGCSAPRGEQPTAIADVRQRRSARPACNTRSPLALASLHCLPQRCRAQPTRPAAQEPPRPLPRLFACRSDAELRPLAVGIFPLGAMVNHDCRPNAVHTFSGSRMVFRCSGLG